MTRDDHGEIETGVQLLKFVRIHFCQKGRRLHVDVTALGNLHEVGGVFNLRERHAVFFRVLHDFLDGHQFRNVPRRFPGHSEVAVVRGPASGLRAADGAGDAAFPPVVGGKRQLPVPEPIVQSREVIERRPGTFENVAPLVFPEILLQGKDGAGARHELPQARGFGVGEGFGLKGAFNKREERQFRGHAAGFDFFDDVVEVFAGAVGHPAEIIRVSCILFQCVSPAGRVEGRQRKSSADPIPDVGGSVVARGIAAFGGGLIVRRPGFVFRRFRRGKGLFDDGGGKGLRRRHGRHVRVKIGAFKRAHALSRDSEGR